MTTISSKLPEAKRRAWNRFSFTSLGRNQPWQHLILDSQPLELWNNKYMLFKLSSLLYLLKQPQWTINIGFPGDSDGKECACNAGDPGLIPRLGTMGSCSNHSNILAWRIPWTEESGGLQCMEPQRVRHGEQLRVSLQQTNIVHLHHCSLTLGWMSDKVACLQIYMKIIVASWGLPCT